MASAAAAPACAGGCEVRPQLSVPEAVRLASSLFGLDADAVGAKELPSYFDQNFMLPIKPPRGGKAAHGGGDGAGCGQHGMADAHQGCVARVVLKVHNSVDTSNIAFVDGANAAAAVLRSAGVDCCAPLPSSAGGLHALHEIKHVDGSTSTHIVRVYRYIDAEVLGNVPQVPACFWEDLGQVVGRMSQALAGVHHPGLLRAHEWSLETAAAVIVSKLPVLAGLLDERQLQLLKWAITQWDGVADTLPRLPRQVCHTDVNEGNTLVDERCERVVGVIDFGDMQETYAVAEPAIALAYAVLQEVSLQLRQCAAGGGGENEAARTDDDAVVELACKSGRRLLEAFKAVRPLSDVELSVLPRMVAIRVALSVAMGAASAAADPGNSAYLLTTQRPGWQLLAALQRHGWAMLLPA